jgi:histone deacetylase complex regulatory component SIN3
MTREEFVILDYFNSHSMTDEVAEKARKRYDNNGGTQTKPAFEDAKDYVENAKNRLQTLPGAYNTLLDILNGFDSKEFVPFYSS